MNSHQSLFFSHPADQGLKLHPNMHNYMINKCNITTFWDNKLGQGSNGIIYKGEITLNDKSTQSIATKRARHEIDYEDPDFIEHEELNIMVILTETKAPYTVQLHGYHIDNNHYVFHMDYAANGSLERHLTTLNLPQKLQIIDNVGDAIEHLHAFKIIHCDIKPENVLLDENMQAKLCDFDMSYEMVGFKRHFNRGTPIFRAPEILLNLVGQKNLKNINGTYEWEDSEDSDDTPYVPKKQNPNNELTDVYAFAWLLWCVLAEDNMPFPHIKSIAKLIQEVVVEDKRMPLPDKCEKRIANFITLGWAKIPDARPNMRAYNRIIKKTLRECDDLPSIKNTY